VIKYDDHSNSRICRQYYFYFVWLFRMRTFFSVWHLHLSCSQFHQHCTRAFFVRKAIKQLLSSYILALQFFGARILAKKVWVKSWRNWHLNYDFSRANFKTFVLFSSWKETVNAMAFLHNFLCCIISHDFRRCFIKKPSHDFRSLRNL